MGITPNINTELGRITNTEEQLIDQVRTRMVVEMFVLLIVVGVTGA
jgi:hypothetical protein